MASLTEGTPTRPQRTGTGLLTPGAELPAADRLAMVPATILFAALMAVSTRYGWHRDELYFLDCARHLSASYVDQPVLTPLLARVSLALFGVWLPGLRLWVALAGAVTVILAVLLARELGGGPRAQRLAAVGTAVCPALIGSDHLFGPTAFDLLAWTGLALVVTRIGRTGQPRLWLLAGLVLGLGVANKHSIVFFAVALVAGVCLARGWRQLASWWFVAGTLIAVAFAVPDLWWQAGHGWAAIAMTRSLARENGGWANALKFIPGELTIAPVVLIWVWLAGLRALWRSGPPLWRALAWAYPLLFVFFAVTAGAKPYYLAGCYPYLLAAGSVTVAPRLTGAASRWLVAAAVTVSTAVSLPFVLPVLPARDTGFVAVLNPTSAEMVGWPDLTHTVARVWRALPAGQRAQAVVFTTDYGEAGAITELGRPLGLPAAVSGHNSEWWWGPGNPHASTVVAVAPGPMDGQGYQAYLRRFFGSVRVAATLTNSAGLHNQEYGGHVYVCTHPREPWGRLWPALRHYG